MKYKHEIVTKTIAVNDENLTSHVHKIASLLKRWLLGTHQNNTSIDYLNYYLDEFTFRCKRRKSNSRGLLFMYFYRKLYFISPSMKIKIKCLINQQKSKCVERMPILNNYTKGLIKKASLIQCEILIE